MGGVLPDRFDTYTEVTNERAVNRQPCEQNGPVQQRVSRVTVADGTEIAYASAGSGRPLVYVSGWLSHLELSWELAEERAFYESLGEGRRLIRYDRAGCGLSGPLIGPPSLERELE